mgnify:CR=1 FL=1
MRLLGRVAIVTGAARGIGRGISLALAREGARVAACDLDLSLLDDLVGQVRGQGGQVLPLAVDVTRKDQIQQAVARVLDQWDRVDILVNNAGIYEVLPVEAISEAQWDRVLNVNLKGAFLCCQAVIPAMKRQGRGKIVNMASLAGRTGRPGVGVNYAAAKAGIIALTQTLAREAGPAGVYVNCLAPGPILTELTKQVGPEVFKTWNVGRAVNKDGLPEDVAQAVLFLASDQSDWITGVTLDINGGILIR